MRVEIRENWLTGKPDPKAKGVTAALGALLFFCAFLYFTGILGADAWMPASALEVFGQNEYWRAWTTLFAHADLGHILGNALLFLPLTYALTAYFSLWFFPACGLFMGGLVNLLVLKTLPPQTELIGISGVVYWMGAAWLTLHLLIDHREKLRRRFGGALFLTLFLFVPETIHPEVSYLTHFLGFVSGALSACLYYWLRRRQFQAAEIAVYAFEPHPEEEPENGLHSYYE